MYYFICGQGSLFVWVRVWELTMKPILFSPQGSSYMPTPPTQAVSALRITHAHIYMYR